MWEGDQPYNSMKADAVFQNPALSEKQNDYMRQLQAQYKQQQD